ncbi:MAG TPA: IPT/TIG domain-containing protein [Methylomirabilota bacterium]|nr:IPT/TIG domain-containing protein [Methylomirabilota bacterium]
MRHIALLIFATLASSPCVALAQPPRIYYVYDDLNRLAAVVDQQGDVAVYTYDAVGNILRIERFDATALPGTVGIAYFTTQIGPAGTSVQIFGKGFGATPGQNTVSFNGVAAVVTAAASNRLIVMVPPGATSGAISVTTPAGSASSGQSFRVLGALALIPAAATTFVGATVPFTATEGGTPTTSVHWAVNGLRGGSPNTGTISATGLYTAPSAPTTATITATSTDLSTHSASAQVTVIPPLPSFAASRVVTVAVGEPAPVSNRSVTAMASVAFEPVITGVSPASGTRGATTPVTVVGAGFGGATALVFLRNNVIDAAIAAANLVVSADGSTATADVTVAAGAIAGGRVVQIVTASGSSSRLGTGGNTVTVQ